MRAILIATAIALAVMSPKANAGLNFDFSFSNVTGDVPGTVTGEIFGLTDNGVSSATNIVLTSYPGGLGLTAAPWDIFHAPGFTIYANGFVVSGGQIIALDFGGFISGLTAILDMNYLDNPLPNVTGLQGPFGDAIENRSGFSGISFSPAIPEPTSAALLLSGFFALGLIRRRA